jgi:WD40 repeat protein
MFRAAIALDDDKTVVASDGPIVSRWCVSEGDVENVPLEGNPEHLVNVQSVSISPDGRLVATAANRVVIIWQADNGTIMWGPLEGHDGTIYALNFSADSKMVVSGSDDRKVWVWSTETGRSVCGPMESHTAGVRGVCFKCIFTHSDVRERNLTPQNSPDGMQVASGMSSSSRSPSCSL